MKSKIFLRVIILSLGLFMSIPAQADTITPSEAKSWAEAKGNQLLNTFAETDLEKRYAALDKMFLENIDLNYIAQFVVGKYWRQMSAEQRQRYQDIFTRYALSIYKSFPLEFDTSQITFSITKAQIRRDYAQVYANIHLNQEVKDVNLQNILVEFRLNKTNGKLRIIDLKLGESSLILSYRNRFYEMIAQDDGDIEWFLEDLETVTQSTELQNKQKLEDQAYM